MRNRAGGLLIEDGKLLLMFRRKSIDGIIKEYYVVPGGGIEDGENIETATKRELKEEIGIEVELLHNEPLLILEEEKGKQYFSIVERIRGNIGTGCGPEFSDSAYADKGVYRAEMISIEDIICGKINMVPEKIKVDFINIVNCLNKDVSSLSSKDFTLSLKKQLKI